MSGLVGREQSLGNVRIVPQRAITKAGGLPPRIECDVRGTRKQLDRPADDFACGADEVRLVGAAEELDKSRRLAVKQRHLPPAPQASMQDTKSGIVGGTIGYENESLGYRRAVVAAGLEKDSMRAVVAGFLHDGYFFGWSAGALISLNRDKAINGGAWGGGAEIE